LKWDACFQGHAQVQGRRAQLCMAGEKQALVEKLRALAQYQLAVYASRFPGYIAQETLNTLSGTSEQVRVDSRRGGYALLGKAQTAAVAGLWRGFATPHSTQIR